MPARTAAELAGRAHCTRPLHAGASSALRTWLAVGDAAPVVAVVAPRVAVWLRDGPIVALKVAASLGDGEKESVAIVFEVVPDWVWLIEAVPFCDRDAIIALDETVGLCDGVDDVDGVADWLDVKETRSSVT